MSQVGGQGGGGSHSLAFRVMRLCRPSFNIEPPFRLNPANLFDDPAAKPLSFSSAATHNGESDPNYRNRFLLRHFSDAIGLSDLLILPQSFWYSFLSLYLFNLLSLLKSIVH